MKSLQHFRCSKVNNILFEAAVSMLVGDSLLLCEFTCAPSIPGTQYFLPAKMTSFAKVLVRRTTRKLSKYKWMDPSKDWGQNRGSRGAGKQESNGKTGNLDLQEGELPKFSLYCLLFRRRRPRVRETYRCRMAMKQQSNTKENLL